MRASKKNFEIKKVRIKVAVSEDKLDISVKPNKLNPLKKEDSPPITDVRKTTPMQMLKGELNGSVEIVDELEDNLECYVKIYHCIINLMDAMRKVRNIFK